MASNSMGQVFRITTWGESHGRAIGVVIDGCPAGLLISEDEVNEELVLRAPGRNAYMTSRQEHDRAEIYSGVFEGKTTGAPISIIIHNQDACSQSYEPIKDLLRPGHANFTYLEKYGVFDYRGGGRASARETACRVAAAAIAKKLLAHFGVLTCAYLSSVAELHTQIDLDDVARLKTLMLASPIFCPDAQMAQSMMNKVEQAKRDGDSLGACVGFVASGVPIGLGDPVYEKLEANLARAMLSIPASKGFEIGEGFGASCMSGSLHNDAFIVYDGKVQTSSNHAGGTLGGISTGMPLYGRVAFKPTSSIQKAQTTVDVQGNASQFKLPEGSRHDPCVAIRAVPVVDAMCALVLVDVLLMNRLARLG